MATKKPGGGKPMSLATVRVVCAAVMADTSVVAPGETTAPAAVTPAAMDSSVRSAL